MIFARPYKPTNNTLFTMKIANWLSESTDLLQSVGIDSARLDCLILLETTLNYSRVEVLTRLAEEIPEKFVPVLNDFRQRRYDREPLAYITGTKEFYGRLFNVNRHTLIPRPESETIIEVIKSLPNVASTSYKIADIGTGSGNLAITLALELPMAIVDAYDIDKDTLEVAATNNSQLNAGVNFYHSNLLDASDLTYDIIVANLPYVSMSQKVSVETSFEPQHALYAKQDGLQLILALLAQITDKNCLSHKGYLVLESEPRQHQQIEQSARERGLQLVQSSGFIQLFQHRS